MTQDIEDVEPEVEEEDLSQFLTDEEKATAEEVEEQDTPAIPDKYAGKTVEEVIEMHKNLEHYLGLPADRRVEKMRQDGLIEKPSEDIDIDDDVSLPDETDMIRSAALNNFKMLNASLSLGIKFDAEGNAVNYNPDDEEQRDAWNTAVENAESTIRLFSNQLKPIQNAISKKGINNEIMSLANEIEGTDATEVLKSFSKIDPDQWKSYTPEIRKMLVQDRAKAVAYDLSLQNKAPKADTPKVKHEKPLNQDVSTKIGGNKTAEFEHELDSLRNVYREQLSNNVLTEQDLVDIVNQTRSK